MSQQWIDLFEGAVEFVIPVGIGILVLLYGRRLFWILGGGTVGLVSGIIMGIILEPAAFQLHPIYGISLNFQADPEPPIFIAIAIGGIIGILLTLRAPKIAAGVVGFVAGVIILFGIFELFGVNLPEAVRRTLFLISGIALAYVAVRNQNQTMILLSTLLGAGLILDGFGLNWNEPISAIFWLLLMLTGIIFQTNSLRIQELKAAAARSQALSNLTPTG